MFGSRREFLAVTAASLSAASALAGAGDRPSTGMGVVLDSYAVRMRVGKNTGFGDPLKFLAFCRERRLGGVQLPIGVRDAEYVKKLRSMLDESGMYLEGSIRPPRDKTDAERFDVELATASAAGATVVRTVMLGGRRYETFRKAEDYHAFKERARQSLEIAEPIVARRKVRLAVENHKDFRTRELTEVMRHLGSEYIGVCVDTGNNLALLEEPAETINELAPFALSCHFKDMAVEESSNGFLLAEVPLGEGFLDLKTIMQTLRRARPQVRFNLEMITRDPLSIPCLTDTYWATFGDVPGRDLARSLTLVRQRARKERLPRVSSLALEQQLSAEDRNVQLSIKFARERLEL
jgi:sugar phosphate isomerase/epimerase